MDYLIAGSLSALKAGGTKVFWAIHWLAIQRILHDKVRLMVTCASQFTPLGRIPSQRNFTVVTGNFNTGSDVDGQLMITYISDAGKLLRF